MPEEFNYVAPELHHEVLTVPDVCGGMRLDQVAAKLLPTYSRSRLQDWIRDGQLTVDGQVRRVKDKLSGGEQIELNASLQPQVRWIAQPIALNVVYEDEAILVIDKPVGLVVHPAAGHVDGTLLNALLHHVPQAATLPRAGIVHRIDKETSGLLVMAKTLAAHTALVAQMQAKSISREYEAIVQGVMTAGGTVNAPIGRHPAHRIRMAVREDGKSAVTHYRIIRRFRHHGHLKVQLETGRTHQIRVHMAHIHYPLVGDPLYGGRLRVPPQATPELIEALQAFRHQALHARRLGLTHPLSGHWLEWESPLPTDFAHLLALLQDDAVRGT
jgi:23S rRNA pseudouridine1911/1915/1917 synthase